MNLDDADDMILNGLNETDRKILASVILGVDITEVFSPERAAQVAKLFSHISRSSMDLTNGWDFNREDHKRKAWERIKEESPVLLNRMSAVHFFLCPSGIKQGGART